MGWEEFHLPAVEYAPVYYYSASKSDIRSRIGTGGGRRLCYNSGQEHMVLQILANAGQVLDDLNFKTVERLYFSDTREHQKLRAMDGARGLGVNDSAKSRVFILRQVFLS